MQSNKDVSVILLAGGVGSRFGSEIPKQFLKLGHAPVALHSFQVFCSLNDIAEIAVVCAPEYQKLFPKYSSEGSIKFAPPGKRRQDSVYNGLHVFEKNTPFICVHDSARPLITEDVVRRVFAAAREHGAATVGVPVKFTIKAVDASYFVQNTPDRTSIWEIQTPQVMRTEWLKEGFDYVNNNNITVTDDVSLVEQLNYPVKLVNGDSRNLKITTTEDFTLLEKLLESAPQTSLNLMSPQDG
ncbi:MAG: 2-C-methyl-D-erythritol 4-phosphate cytidylyltransferase [Waddliaceae bacterium]